MSDLGINVDEIVNENQAIPADLYETTIKSLDFAVDQDTDERKTDKNGNEYLSGMFVVTAGEYSGKHLFLNYLNPTSVKFKKMCEAAGRRGRIETTEELIGLPIRVKVGKQLYRDEEQNTILGFV